MWFVTIIITVKDGEIKMVNKQSGLSKPSYVKIGNEDNLSEIDDINATKDAFDFGQYPKVVDVFEETQNGELKYRNNFDSSNSLEYIEKISEGNIGALKLLSAIMDSPNGKYTISMMDDMNIRGCQIVRAFNDICNFDINQLMEKFMNPSEEFVDRLNYLTLYYDEVIDKAILSGARELRETDPESLVFPVEIAMQLIERYSGPFEKGIFGVIATNMFNGKKH